MRGSDGSAETVRASGGAGKAGRFGRFSARVARYVSLVVRRGAAAPRAAVNVAMLVTGVGVLAVGKWLLELDTVVLLLLIGAALLLVAAVGSYRAWSEMERAYASEVANSVAVTELPPNPWGTPLVRALISIRLGAQQLDNERVVRGDDWYVEAVTDWVGKSVRELDREAPELVDKFTASDGIEPPHDADATAGYLRRRVQWLTTTERTLREGNRARPLAEVLDDLIRSGQAARDRLRFGLVSGDKEARLSYMAWFFEVSEVLSEKAPADWDNLMNTTGEDGAGADHLARVFDAKLDVLKRVRKEQ